MTNQPRVTDNDADEITVTLDDKELRGWSYKDDAERRIKMLAAREYVEGWCEGAQRSSDSTEAPWVPGFVKPDNDRQVFFYEQDFYVLSNFAAFRLDWNGLIFDTSEAAYHYEKFAGTVYENIGREIRNAPSAHEAFKLAELHKDRRRLDWDDVKISVMRDILHAKAAQHEYVRRKLLATGNRELIEDSWRDSYWGWGPNRDGLNMLGKLWMQVRGELRAAAVSSTHSNTVAEPSRCKNPVARGESKEADAATGDAPVASASTLSVTSTDQRGTND